jgi:hypothetical protein
MAASIRYLFVFSVLLIYAGVMSLNDSAAWELEASAGDAAQSISKVRPASPEISKVKPLSGFEGLDRYNPVNWGPACYLPAPVQGQFVLSPRLFFANVSGEARHTLEGGLPGSLVKFDEQLGLRSSGNVLWSIGALYQFRPRWAITYRFSPLSISADHAPATGFQFSGHAFAAGTDLHSKWDRWEHRAGLLFNLSRTSNAMTSVFADWLYVQDRLSIGETGAQATAVTWDDTKSMALLGVEFDKCLKNYRGNTLALTASGAFAFLDDSIGYDAEAGLNYMIPIKTGRFGFVKGGYRYFNLKKETETKVFGSTLHGAFISLGFLF